MTDAPALLESFSGPGSDDFHELEEVLNAAAAPKPHPAVERYLGQRPWVRTRFQEMVTAVNEDVYAKDYRSSTSVRGDATLLGGVRKQRRDVSPSPEQPARENQPEQRANEPEDEDDPLKAPRFNPRASDQAKRAVLAFERDLPGLMETHLGQWVAYCGDERVGIKKTSLELYEQCLSEGRNLEDCIVRPIKTPGVTRIFIP